MSLFFPLLFGCEESKYSCFASLCIARQIHSDAGPVDVCASLSGRQSVSLESPDQSVWRGVSARIELGGTAVTGHETVTSG